MGEVDMIVRKAVDAAQRDANDMMDGVQQYALYAYYPDDATYVPRKYFRVSTEENVELDRDMSPSEPPTEKGLTGQLMRHNEAIMKTATVSQSFILQIFQREMARLADMNETYAKQHLDMTMLVQDTLNQAAERRQQEKKTDMSLAFQEGAFEHLKTAMPIILNRIAGKPVFPEPDKAFMLMATLLESLTPEQQGWFRDNLAPGQNAILAEILGEYEKKKDLFTKEKRTSDEFGKQNALPPPAEPSQLAPMHGKEKMAKMFSKLGERLEQDPATSSPDPKTRALEELAKKLGDRFKDQLHPKPTT
jgi:hypothetical protein